MEPIFVCNCLVLPPCNEASLCHDYHCDNKMDVSKTHFCAQSNLKKHITVCLLRGAVYSRLWLISQDEWTNGNCRPPSPSTGCCFVLKRAIIVSLKIFDATEDSN